MKSAPLSGRTAHTVVAAAALVLGSSQLLERPIDGQPGQGQGQRTPTAAVDDVTSRGSAAQLPASLSKKAVVELTLREMTAAAGFATALLYVLDENGKRIPEKADDPTSPSKERATPLPWAVVLGVVDHRAIEKTLLDGKPMWHAAAEHFYRRVELERQERSANDGWSRWAAVDPEPSTRILDNLPEVSYEKVAEEVRIPSLVDSLPSLKKGAWAGIDATHFVSAKPGKEVRAPAEPKTGRRESSKRSLVLPEYLMVRQFDFTVERGRTYRYRARLVLDDARARRREVQSPWSAPTVPVTVP